MGSVSAMCARRGLLLLFIGLVGLLGGCATAHLHQYRLYRSERLDATRIAAAEREFTRVCNGHHLVGPRVVDTGASRIIVFDRDRDEPVTPAAHVGRFRVTYDETDGLVWVCFSATNPSGAEERQFAAEMGAALRKVVPELTEDDTSAPLSFGNGATGPG